MSDVSRPSRMNADGQFVPLTDTEFEQWKNMTGGAATSAPALPPDGQSLSDWRIAVRFWGRFDDLQARAKELLDSGSPLGVVVDERLNRSNVVYRADLMALKDALGFTAGEVDESLWRADRITKGDYSGTWPIAG